MTRSQHRQQVVIRWSMRVSALVLALFVAVCAGVIPLQSARIASLQDANLRRASENSDLTKIVNNAQTQYDDLFAACQKSVECLAHAPSATLVVGPTGATGPGASDSQVGAQVRGYCSLNNGCQGPKGDTGDTGQAGASGTPGTDGATGATGTDGAAGADGRGIASTVCDNSGEWQVTYTDGSTQDAGNCRMSLIP